ncbi:hypothetical protein BDN67DRAFT_1008928 [Paxillus ammoniavirescens]|nr:hypothetical protein BDN67DRAFT_1008928 [Paxillus ammoniavirescens]
MSPMLKATSDIYQGQVGFGAPAQKEEYGSEERIERGAGSVITEAQETKLWHRIDLRLTVPPYALATVTVLVRSLCVIGSYSTSPGFISWLVMLFFNAQMLANNLQGKYKRVVGMALQISAANLEGAAACNIFPIPIIVLTYKRTNAQMDREDVLEKQQGQDVESKEEGGASSMSYEAPGFRYTL